MSTFLDKADELKTHLESLPIFDGIPIIVDRQKNISIEITKAVSKVKGLTVTILWLGAPPNNPEDSDPNFTSRYAIRVIGKPILNRGGMPADEVVEEVLRHLWQLDDDDPLIMNEWRIDDVDLVPDNSYLIYEIIANVRTYITKP